MYLRGRFSFELVWSGRYSKGSSESVRKEHPDYVAGNWLAGAAVSWKAAG